MKFDAIGLADIVYSVRVDDEKCPHPRAEIDSSWQSEQVSISKSNSSVTDLQHGGNKAGGIIDATGFGATASKALNTGKTTLPSIVIPERIVKPKRPLTAYNIFFRSERARLLGAYPPSSSIKCCATKRRHRKTHGRIGFIALAKLIGERWNGLEASEKEAYYEEATEDLKRHRIEMEVYNKKLHNSLSRKQTTEQVENHRKEAQKRIEALSALFEDRKTLGTKEAFKRMGIRAPDRTPKAHDLSLRAVAIANRKPKISCFGSDGSPGSSGPKRHNLCASFRGSNIDSLSNCQSNDHVESHEENHHMNLGEGKSSVSTAWPNPIPGQSNFAIPGLGKISEDAIQRKNSDEGPQRLIVFGKNIFEVD